MKKGLHDLSASLLNGEQSIDKQLKRYSNAVVLFMPMPEEIDQKIFFALKRLLGHENEVIREIDSVFTHMPPCSGRRHGHCLPRRLADQRKKKPIFNMGLTGRKKKPTSLVATPVKGDVIAARRTSALQYKSILEESLGTVNEVVMAYRKHESKLFPMFAKWKDSYLAWLTVIL